MGGRGPTMNVDGHSPTGYCKPGRAGRVIYPTVGLLVFNIIEISPLYTVICVYLQLSLRPPLHEPNCHMSM